MSLEIPLAGLGYLQRVFPAMGFISQTLCSVYETPQIAKSLRSNEGQKKGVKNAKEWMSRTNE